ncbi:hypothetical protein BH11MYX3_BH11MYX3_46180 [soil metagenome]
MSGILAAGAVAKGALATLAMLAMQGTVLAVIALVVLRAARMRPAVSSAVWLVVLAKFALPWGPAMPWSLSDFIAYLRHDEVGSALRANPIGAGPETAISIAPSVAWIALASVWALGTIVVLSRALLSYRATLQTARNAPAAPASAQTLLASLGGTARLAVGDPSTGPYVVGLLRPIIVVPPALLDDSALLRAALLHELAHVRRKDALGRFLQVWAAAMFFWWPVVRLIGRRLDHAREAACDAWALEVCELPRPAYARLLVKMAALRTGAATALASPHSLEARVAAVLGPPTRARIGLVGKAAIVAWAVMALGGARTASARGEKNVCVYTPQIAEALRQAYPEADLDGDGQLSKDEACELQAEVRRRVDPRSDQVSLLLEEPLCCNCGAGDGLLPSPDDPAASSCQVTE